MTIGEHLKTHIGYIRARRARPRQYVIRWMRRNNPWYQELVAKEWQRQTGEDWLDILKASVA